MVLVLLLVVLLCTMVMVTDYIVKKAKYAKWKARPGSGMNSPEHCSTYAVQEQYHSLSTISEYIPLCSESRESELQVHNHPISPIKRRRRRLLRRRETLSDWCINKRSEIRKSSLPSKIKLNRSYSTKDCVDSPRRPSDLVSECRINLGTRSHSLRRHQASLRGAASASMLSSGGNRRSMQEAELERSESEMTLRPPTSVSGFSCNSMEQELEYDLYDCDIGNVMAAPGSMFAPAYWDRDTTPTLDLELTELFPREQDEEQVELRGARRGGNQTTSITSDLTSSISSAVSGCTLVGEESDGSEEPGEHSKLLHSGELDTSCYYSGDESEPCLKPKPEYGAKKLLNITPVDGISFVDD